MRAVVASPEAFRVPAGTLFILGWWLRQDERDSAEAEGFLREARRRQPDDFWINFLLANRMEDSTPPHDEEAIRFYTVAVALRPESPAAHVNLGAALKRKGQLDDAIAEYRQALHIKGDWALARYNLGHALRENGRLDEGIAEFREAIRIDKDFLEAHTSLGLALRDKGQLDEAIAELRQAVRIKPGADTHNNLGQALLAKGQLNEALAQFQQILRFQNDAWARSNVGDALHTKRQLDEAITEYRLAVQIDKGYARAHNNLGNALADKGQLDEAIREFREAIRLKKDFADAHHNLGTVLKEKGELDEAIKEFRKAIQIEPDSANPHHGLGQMFRDKGQVDDAIAEFRTAIKFNPNLVQRAGAYVDLGAVLCDLKRDYDGAIAAFREALRIKPDLAEAHHNVGVALEGKGQWQDAIAEFREAIRIKKDYTEAQSKLRQAERLLELDRKLHVILSGKLQPADTAERIALAELCQLYKKRYLAALRFYEEAFTAEPKLTGDQPSLPRYNAACAAALAGCGQGEDADKLGPNAYARLRRQALNWLRADMAAWRKILEGDRSKAASAVRQQMQHWLQDTDFAGVRGPDALAKLAEAERQDWLKLWAEVDGLRQVARDSAKKSAN